MATTDAILRGVSISGVVGPEHKKILTPEALAFLTLLHRSFNVTRKKLLERRVIRQAEIDRGTLPDFLPETRYIREDPTWKGAPPAPGLVDRRVEITGPTDRKMVVNALNSDVWTYMADFEGMYHFSHRDFTPCLGEREIRLPNVLRYELCGSIILPAGKGIKGISRRKTANMKIFRRGIRI